MPLTDHQPFRTPGAASRQPEVRPLVVRAVVVCVTVTLLAVGLGLAQPDGGQGSIGSVAAAPVATPVAAASCANLLVIALDGNGQGGKGRPGAVVRRVVKDLKSRAGAEGRSIAVRSMKFATPKADIIVKRRNQASTRTISKARLRKWRKPVAAQVRSTRALVNQQIQACPEQQVVLVGYAQGAAVTHRVLQGLGSGKRAHVSGAVTVSDPWRVKKSVTGKPLGAPAAGRSSAGVLTRFGAGVGDVPATSDTFRVVSVCTKGDLVCNPTRLKAKKALKRGAYATKGARSALSGAGWALWQRVRTWPVPTTTQVTAVVDEPFTQRLAVAGGSSGRQPAVWAATSLPSGVSLSADGVLSGRVTVLGSHQVRYTVAGVSPTTPRRQGLLTLRVYAQAGDVSAGGQTTCEVRPGGDAWCWGDNAYGQVGDGTTTTRPVRARVKGSGWATVSTGGAVTCGTKDDGSLWCWGLNNFGQLGRGDKATKTSPRRIGSGTSWREVAVSWHHACALQTNGTAWCWGSNENGQVGIGSTGRTSTPTQVAGSSRFTSLTTGGWHSCGVTRSGDARCWGGNKAGQLGDGTAARRVKPKKVNGSDKYASLSADWVRTCGVTTRGTVNCWGDNANGELGNGTRTSSSTPVVVSGGSTSWATVDTGMSHTCAADTSGAVSCWGDNRYGQLGPLAGSSSTTPVATGVTSAGAVLSTGWMHTCAATGVCWGADDLGQLASGVTVPVRMPAKSATSWAKTVFLTKTQLKNRKPARIARDVVKGRPSVTARAKRQVGASFGIMSFNVLGTQHSAPGASRAAWAPGRARTEWGRTLVESRGVSLVGLSEPQLDQIDSYNQALNNGWTIYPGRTMGYAPGPQSLMWRDSDWELVWANTATMPFMRDARPQPVVRLRHKATGREIYWINAHLSPGNMEADRNKGMAIIVALVKALQGDGLPVMVTGDLNAKDAAFRRVGCAAGMDAAVGGVSTGGTCKLPSQMRVDWIFGKGGSFSRTVVDTSARVFRTTDHAVVSSTFTLR